MKTPCFVVCQYFKEGYLAQAEEVGISLAANVGTSPVPHLATDFILFSIGTSPVAKDIEGGEF